MAFQFKQDDIPPPSHEGKLKPFTSEEWARLTPKQQWDTIVALRGPDLRGSDSAKWYSTSVIRGKMRGILRVGGMVNTDLNLMILPSGGDVGIKPRPNKPMKTEAPNKLYYPTYVEEHLEHEKCVYCAYQEEKIDHLSSIPRFDYSHFFQHIHEAGDILSIPVMFIDSTVWSNAMFQYSYTRAGLVVLDWALKQEGAFSASIIKELKRHLRFEKKVEGE